MTQARANTGHGESDIGDENNDDDEARDGSEERGEEEERSKAVEAKYVAQPFWLESNTRKSRHAGKVVKMTANPRHLSSSDDPSTDAALMEAQNAEVCRGQSPGSSGSGSDESVNSPNYDHLPLYLKTLVDGGSS